MFAFLFSFEGRLRRLHWWLASYGAIIGAIAIIVGEFALFYFLFPETRSGQGGFGNTNPLGANIFMSSLLILFIALVWSSLAVSVKRLHDRDKSGWWVLIELVPFGAIWAFIEYGFLDGTQGPNKYGPSPKGAGAN